MSRTPPAPALREASLALIAPVVVLALGHMLSNLVRTLPAITVDVLSRDLNVTPDGVAALTGGFLLAFAAGQIPLGVALDRFGVRPVSLALLLTVSAGAVIAAVASGPWSFLLAQVVMGLGCCGMLLCPMTYAARILTPVQFGLWSGLIQAMGNMGMLLSASPLAWLVEVSGWRAGFLASVAFGLATAALVFLVVRDTPPARDPRRTLWSDTKETLSLAASPALRGLIAIAFASFAAVIGIRGLWGGPWLMEVKGLSRIAAGNLLLVFTFALIVGPALAGVLDRHVGRRAGVLAIGHWVAAAALLLLVAGGPSGPVAALFGREVMPPSWDLATLLLFGLAVSVQPLTFALTRMAVPPEQTGRALAAVNLSFFGGAAVLQALSGPMAIWGGIEAGIGLFAVALGLCTALFVLLPGPR